MYQQLKERELQQAILQVDGSADDDDETAIKETVITCELPATVSAAAGAWPKEKSDKERKTREKESCKPKKTETSSALGDGDDDNAAAGPIVAGEESTTEDGEPVIKKKESDRK